MPEQMQYDAISLSSMYELLTNPFLCVGNSSIVHCIRLRSGRKQGIH